MRKVYAGLLAAGAMLVAAPSFAQLTVYVDGAGAPDTAGGPYSKLSLATAYLNANSTPTLVSNIYIRTNNFSDNTQVLVNVPMVIEGDGEAVPDGVSALAFVDIATIRAAAHVGETDVRTYIEVKTAGDVTINNLNIGPSVAGNTTPVDAVRFYRPASGVGEYEMNNVIASPTDSSNNLLDPETATDLYYLSPTRRWYAFGADSGIFVMTNFGAGAGTYNTTLNNCKAGVSREAALNIGNSTGTTTINGGVYGHAGTHCIRIRPTAQNVTLKGTESNRLRVWEGNRSSAGNSLYIESGAQIDLIEYVDLMSDTANTRGINMQGGTIDMMRFVRSSGNGGNDLYFTGNATATIENSTFHNKQATGTAGITPVEFAAAHTGSVTFKDCIITGLQATDQVTIGGTGYEGFDHVAAPTDGYTGESLSTSGAFSAAPDNTTNTLTASPHYLSTTFNITDEANRNWLAVSNFAAYETASSTNGELRGGATAVFGTAPNDINVVPSVVTEGNTTPTVVGTLSSVDPDGDTVFTYALVSGTGDTDNALFSISGTDLILNEVADADVKPSYSVRVSSTDPMLLAYSEALTITVAKIAGVGDLVINEFSYDDSGTDSHEFVELYNASGSLLNISGYQLVGGDTNPDVTVTIPASTFLAAGDYYVIGQTGVPNVDYDTVTPTNLPDFQNDMEYLALYNATAVLLDSVVYERNKAATVIPNGIGEPPFNGSSATSGGGYWGNTTLVEAGSINQGSDPSFASLSVSRRNDGYDTDNNSRDFIALVATPGAANNSVGTVTSLPYTQDFDSVSSGTYIVDMPGSFVSMRAADPAVAQTVGAGSVNPSVIPASPDGGNVGVFWDASGGGNSGIVNLNGVFQNLQVETYVYVDDSALPGAETETYSITIGGGEQALYNTGTFSGDYGVRALFVRSATGTSLTLQEAASGAATTIGSTYDFPSSGWYRLLMQVLSTGEAEFVVGGNFGDNGASGTYGFSGTTTLTEASSVALGYREAITTDQNARPLTVDNFTVRVSGGALTIGSAVNEWMLLND